MTKNCCSLVQRPCDKRRWPALQPPVAAPRGRLAARCARCCAPLLVRPSQHPSLFCLLACLPVCPPPVPPALLQVTISLLQRAMDESGSTKPFLIDGFPRNEENRSQFEKQVRGCIAPASCTSGLLVALAFSCKRARRAAQVPACNWCSGFRQPGSLPGSQPVCNVICVNMCELLARFAHSLSRPSCSVCALGRSPRGWSPLGCVGKARSLRAAPAAADGHLPRAGAVL